MKTPFFSIIIPTFNQSSFLQKALKSVFNQTFKNFEVIVVDNNSKDGTKKVVKSFNKIVYRNINNEGIISKSRNLGLKISRGKWIAFLDSDDFWDKDKLKISYNLIKTKKFDVICHNEWVQNLFNITKKKKIYSYGPFSKDFYKKMLLYGNRTSTSATIVKKQFLNKYKLKFEENKFFITSEDYSFFLHIANLNGVFIFLNKPLGYHTFHKKSMSYNYKRHMKSKMKVLKYHTFKVQTFEKNKQLLFDRIKSINDIKNSLLNLRKGYFIKKNIKILLNHTYVNPILTFKYFFLLLKLYIKQRIIVFLY